MIPRILVTLHILTVLALPAVAATKGVVIVDVSTGKAANTPSLDRRWYVFPETHRAPAVDALHALENKPTSLEATKAALKKLEQQSDPRIMLAAGDTFDVIVLYTDDQLLPSVAFTEERRQTRFAEDFATLVKLAVAIGTKEIAGKPVVYKLHETKGGTNGTYARSTIKVSVKTKTKAKQPAGDGKAGAAGAAGAAPAVVPAAGPAAVTAFDPDTMTPDITVDVALVNGPTEHFFISADIPVTKTSEIKYDDAGHAIGTKSAPTTVYAGVNFMLGDVIAANRARWTDGLMVKAMAKLSERPADSYGVGVGYRFPAQVKVYGYDLNNLSVFVAYLRTRTVENDVKIFSNGLRGGISLNLDRALEWVKPAPKK
jgi:hypothetical protein